MPQPTQFDPDAFMATQPKGGGFDPDAFMASQQPQANPVKPAMAEQARSIEPLSNFVGQMGNTAHQVVEGAKSLGRGALNMAMEPGESLVNGVRQLASPGHRMEGLGNMAKGVGKAALMIGAPEAGGAALNAIPRTSRAAENFEKAMAIARHEPVDVSHFAQPVLRAQHINAVAGDPMAPVLRKALTRVGPTTNPLTYGDLRIMASSAGRKAQQQAMGGTLTGEMGARLGEAGKGMDVAAQEAAERASPAAGEFHGKAMKEYAQASRNKEIAKKAAKVALPLAGAGALYRGYNELKP